MFSIRQKLYTLLGFSPRWLTIDEIGIGYYKKYGEYLEQDYLRDKLEDMITMQHYKLDNSALEYGILSKEHDKYWFYNKNISEYNKKYDETLFML